MVTDTKLINTKVLITGSIDTSGKYEFKTTELLDKKYSVLPAVMMVEGKYTPYVENLYEKSTISFSGKELSRSVNSWNGRPVAINHPDGQETCNSPSNYQKQWVGTVFNTRYDSPGRKLVSELWVDNERGSSIIDMVSNGHQVNISIGAFGDLEPSRVETYDYQMTNIVGDHLAVLPDGIGACSWKDGCGIRVKAYLRADKTGDDMNEYVAATLSETRTPVYVGVETISWESVGKSFNDYLSGYYKHSGAKLPEGGTGNVKTASAAAKRWIASKTLLGDADADNLRDLVFFPVVNPTTNKLNEGALRAIIGGRGAQANIPSAAKESAQDKARSLLKSKFKVGVKSMEKEKVDAIDMEEKELMCDKDQIKAQEIIQASEKEKDPKHFELDNWLSNLPEETRQYMVHSMKNYEETKHRYINKILSFENVNFCADSLRNVKDMSLLESISSLVDAASTSMSEQVSESKTGEINYQFQAGGYNNKQNYAAFKDITW